MFHFIRASGRPLGLAVFLATVFWSGLAMAQTHSFKLQAPQAKQVYLAGEMTDWDKGKLPMQRDADGNWRLDVDLSPGEWLYKFIVDGKWMFDPTAQHDADGFGDQHSFIFVGDGLWQERADIPHGEVKSLMLPSAAWGRPMKLNVYLPPTYQAGKAYPVLLLLHGKGLDADQWLKTGFINRYMDNLIAQGRIQSYVVVMPSSEQVFYTGQSEQFITSELPAWLKANYGLSPGPESFAVAGMSMGGFGAFYLPFKHPQQFGFGFSISGFFPGEFMPALKQAHSLPFKAMLVSGQDDTVTGTDRAVIANLQALHVPFYYREDPGAHTWHFFAGHTEEMLLAVNTYFTKGTAISNAESVVLPAAAADAPLPIVGQEIAYSQETVPISRILGRWRGEWRLENDTIHGRYEETLTAIKENHAEGTYSVYDTGTEDATDAPFSSTSRIENGHVISTDAAGNNVETVYSVSGKQLWRQWRKKINGNTIIFKLRKIETGETP